MKENNIIDFALKKPALFICMVGGLGFIMGSIAGLPFGFGANLLEWLGLVTPDAHIPSTALLRAVYIRPYFLSGIIFLGTIHSGLFIFLAASAIYLHRHDEKKLTKGQLKFIYLTLTLLSTGIIGLTLCIALAPFYI
jgi:uncharacterized membrane protein